LQQSLSARERLSVDLDFNNRHLYSRDWGKVRDDIDDRVKLILYTQACAIRSHIRLASSMLWVVKKTVRPS
jgi:hypothetical protein